MVRQNKEKFLLIINVDIYAAIQEANKGCEILCSKGYYLSSFFMLYLFAYMELLLNKAIYVCARSSVLTVERMWICNFPLKQKQLQVDSSILLLLGTRDKQMLLVPGQEFHRWDNTTCIYFNFFFIIFSCFIIVSICLHRFWIVWHLHLLFLTCVDWTHR